MVAKICETLPIWSVQKGSLHPSSRRWLRRSPRSSVTRRSYLRTTKALNASPDWARQHRSRDRAGMGMFLAYLGVLRLIGVGDFPGSRDRKAQRRRLGVEAARPFFKDIPVLVNEECFRLLRTQEQSHCFFLSDRHCAAVGTALGLDRPHKLAELSSKFTQTTWRWTLCCCTWLLGLLLHHFY